MASDAVARLSAQAVVADRAVGRGSGCRGGGAVFWAVERSFGVARICQSRRRFSWREAGHASGAGGRVAGGGGGGGHFRSASSAHRVPKTARGDPQHPQWRADHPVDRPIWPLDRAAGVGSPRRCRVRRRSALRGSARPPALLALFLYSLLPVGGPIRWRASTACRRKPKEAARGMGDDRW